MYDDIINPFMEKVSDMRQKVIDAGGELTTLKVSQSVIEEMKIFGMNVEVVSSVVMPKGVDMMVVEDKDKLI